jgi:hypothetical protein
LLVTDETLSPQTSGGTVAKLVDADPRNVNAQESHSVSGH